MITENNLLNFLKKTYPQFAWNIEKITATTYKSLYAYIGKNFIFSILTKHKFTPEIKEKIKRNLPHFIVHYSNAKLTCKLKIKNRSVNDLTNNIL